MEIAVQLNSQNPSFKKYVSSSKKNREEPVNITGETSDYNYLVESTNILNKRGEMDLDVSSRKTTSRMRNSQSMEAFGLHEKEKSNLLGEPKIVKRVPLI